AEGTTWCGVDTRYGLGLQETTTPSGERLVGHGGGLKGVSSQVAWLPDRRVGLVLLTNLGGLPAGLIALAGINAVTGVDVATPSCRPEQRRQESGGKGEYVPRAGEVEELLGRYQSGEPYGRVRLYRAPGGALRAAVGLPLEDLPAELVGPDEVAL